MSQANKKTALITGCSDGGIGATMAKVLCEKGYHVFATLRNTSKAGVLAELSDVDILELDVTSEESIARCAEEVRRRTGGTLDILVNNAGRDLTMPLLDVNIKEARELFDVNFWSVLTVTQAFAPMVVKAKGVIVNHSSISNGVPVPWNGIYSASKAAMAKMSEILRVELEPLGVRVVTVFVGTVRTPIFTNSYPNAFQIPKDSLYVPIEQFLVDKRDPEKQPAQANVDVAARQIVDDVLGGRKDIIWRGGLAGTVRWASWLLPMWAMEMITNGAMGLKELKSYYTKSS